MVAGRAGWSSVITSWTSTGTAVGGGLSGDAFDEGVGHDLAAAARRPGGRAGCRRPGQRGVDRDALGERAAARTGRSSCPAPGAG